MNSFNRCSNCEVHNISANQGGGVDSLWAVRVAKGVRDIWVELDSEEW